MHAKMMRSVLIGLVIMLTACSSTTQVNEPKPHTQLSTPTLDAVLPVSALNTSSVRQVSDTSFSIKGWTHATEASANAEQLDVSKVQLHSTNEELSYTIYGVESTAFAEVVPFIAPYTLDITAENEEPFWVGIADFERGVWQFQSDPYTPPTGSLTVRVDVGLGSNGGRVDGQFWFAIVAWGGAEPIINNVALAYPDVPVPGQPVDYHQFIETLGGAQLATDVYLPYAEVEPSIPDPPYPTLLLRTPYDKADIPSWIVPTLTQINVAVVVQYFRGRPGSEPPGGWPTEWPYSWPDSTGTAAFFTDHAGPHTIDAIDTVTWIEERPWYNGELVLSGASALAGWIYQADTLLGDRVKAVYPQFCAGDIGEWAARENGCYKRSNVEGWITSQGYPTSIQTSIEANLKNESYWEQWDFDQDAGNVTTPGYHETGWYDVNVNATIETWRELQENGGPGAAGNQWLIIGPWAHNTPRAREVGDLTFPSGGGLNDPGVVPFGWDGIHWILNEINRLPIPFTAPTNRVLAYVVGFPESDYSRHNRWFELATWPPPPEDETVLYLNDSGTFSFSFSPGPDDIETYTVNPNFPIPTVGGANLPFLGVIEAGPLEQSSVLGLPGVLQYNADDFVTEKCFMGEPHLVLYAATDAADTDFCIKLLYYDSFGNYYLICDTALRLSHYLAEHDMGPVVPGTVYELDIPLGNIAQVFYFSELHLVIQGTNYPRFDINPGNGDSIYTGINGHVQTNTLYYGTTYPSRLILPEYYPDL